MQKNVFYNIVRSIYRMSIKPVKSYYLDVLATLRAKRKFDAYRYETQKRKIRVVFISQFPEMWNSFKSVYDEMIFDKRFEVFLIALPKKKDFRKNKYYEENDAYEFFMKNGIHAINGYTNGKFFEIKQLRPDYIMIQRAYDAYVPKCYYLYNLQKLAFVCYISYSGRTTKGYHISVEFDSLMRYFHLLFSDCKEVSEYLLNNNSNTTYSKYQKVLDLGFPRFDLFEPRESHNHICKNFLWLPRWGVNKENGISHFYDYVYCLMDFFRERADLNLIIRPHPQMFTVFINSGYKTEKEIEQLKEEIKAIPNIQFDENKDYLASFEQSDVLIADESSLLLEYFFTNNPVILCSNETPKEELTDICSKIFETYYRVSNKKELLRRITLLLNEKDENEQIRRKLVEELNTTKERSCTRIIDAIYRDYLEVTTRA